MVKIIKFTKEHVLDIMTWGLVVGFTILYVSLVFNYNVWTDEAFTIQLLKGNFKEIVEGTARDVHPPFYYFYLKVFTFIFGNSLWAMKIASIIPLTVTLVLGATVIRKRFGQTTAFLYTIFLACIPCSMEFSVQVRMYSLAIFLVTACGIFAYLAFEDGKKRDFFIFGLCGVLAAYTHYFAFMAVIIITGVFFLAILFWNRKRILPWIITAVGMIIGYLPWMPIFVKQITRVRSGYWIPEITPETIWGYFTWTFDLTTFPGMVFIFLIVLKAASTYNTVRIAQTKEKTEIFALICMLVPTLTMLMGVIISSYKAPIYREQYVFPALGLLSLFFAIAMRKAKKVFLVLISAFLLFVGAFQYKECHYQEYDSTLFPQTKEFFDNNLAPSDYIVYNYKTFDFIYECHFPEEQLVYLEDFDFSQDFNAVWFMHTWWTDGNVDVQALAEMGLTVELMGRYGIEHNLFDLYMIYPNVEY